MSITNFLIVCLIIYSVFVFLTRTPDFATSEFIHGKVVMVFEEEFPGSKSSQRPIIYVPVVEYVVNGKTYEFSDETCRWPPIYQVGETVTIIYNPENPHDAYLFALIGYWINISELFGALLVFGIPSAIYLALQKKPSDGLKPRKK